MLIELYKEEVALHLCLAPDLLMKGMQQESSNKKW